MTPLMPGDSMGYCRSRRATLGELHAFVHNLRVDVQRTGSVDGVGHPLGYTSGIASHTGQAHLNVRDTEHITGGPVGE